MDPFADGKEKAAPTMKSTTIQSMVVGAAGALGRVGEATRVEGRTVTVRTGQAVRVEGWMVPYSVKMKARGYALLPRSLSKPFANPWVPAEVATALAVRQKHAQQRAAARKGWDSVMRELIDIDAAGLMQQARAMVAAEKAAAEAELRAQLAVPEVEGRLWGDVAVPPLPASDPVCRPLPAGRLTPPQFREWVVAGWRNVRNAAEARRYEAHVARIRLDQFAQLPDCVFAPAVKHYERDAVELAAYRAGFKATQAQRALREEIRVKSALRVDQQRRPFAQFRTRAEQQAAMRDLGREVKALERKLMPATVAEVVLDGRLWPEAAGPGSWATVVATGRAPKPVVVEVTAEAKAEAEKKAKAEREEAERVARWKKLKVSETTAGTSASRKEWHEKKEQVAQDKKRLPKEDDEGGDTGFNYWREQNY